MNRYLRTAVATAALLGLLATGPVAAGQADLDRAVERYYAGYPGQAIAMLEPLALAGDVEAQYLLGNIVYALAQAGRAPEDQDASRWYRMAAERGAPEANYALGVIYNNRWLEQRDARDARLAQHYYQRAADLGYEPAEAPLLKLATRNQAKRASESRVYSNADFATTRAPAPAPAGPPAASPARDSLAGFALSDDPIADARRLQELLARLGSQFGLSDDPADGGKLPDEATLTRILTGLGADRQLIDNLGKLLDHVRSATEHDLAPGAN